MICAKQKTRLSLWERGGVRALDGKLGRPGLRQGLAVAPYLGAAALSTAFPVALE